MKERREKTHGQVGIQKGRRAKRGRRRDYKDVYLACGIINSREAAALGGLLSISQEQKQDSKNVEIPESEGKNSEWRMQCLPLGCRLPGWSMGRTASDLECGWGLRKLKSSDTVNDSSS